MYNIQISNGKNSLFISFNKFHNDHNDLSIKNILNENKNIINSFFINSKYKLDKIAVTLFDGNEKLGQQTIVQNKKINFMFSDENIEADINLIDTINNLFENLEKYIIELENDEISKVILNNKDIDVNWFINNIYKADTGRYYRKIITFNNMCVFTRDIKL